MDNHYDSRNLCVRCLPEAIVVPGGMHGGGIVHDGRYLPEAMMHRGWYAEKWLQLPREAVDVSGAVVYLGDFYSCWGHCITDGLKFAWAFLPGELQKWVKEDVRFVYITTTPGEKLYENFLQLWDLVGVRREQMLRIDRPTRFERVYLPDESYYLDQESGLRYYTDEYKRTIDWIRGKVMQSNCPLVHDVLFSRTLWKTAKPDFGESRVEQIIADAIKCERISPERLTIEELIRLLMSCKRLITTEGSVAHNSVFLRDGAELVLLSKADYNNGYQPPISQMRNLKVTKLKAHASRWFWHPSEPWRGPFFLRVTRECADYFGVREDFPVIEYVKYLWFCLVRVRVWGTLVKLYNKIGRVPYFGDLLKRSWRGVRGFCT